MFTGEFKHALDEKGRVSVPAGMRNVLRGRYDCEEIVVTRSLHGTCLWGFPHREWEALAQRIAESGLGAVDNVQLKRKFFPAARECPIDKAGRVLIPEELRKHAGIGGDAVFLGMGKYVEIWDPALWAEESKRLDDEDTATHLLETLGKLGL